MKELIFEEVNESELFADYTADCSGIRSDCCTRVCTRNNYVSTEEAWGKFLDVEGGVFSANKRERIGSDDVDIVVRPFWYKK